MLRAATRGLLPRALPGAALPVGASAVVATAVRTALFSRGDFGFGVVRATVVCPCRALHSPSSSTSGARLAAARQRGGATAASSSSSFLPAASGPAGMGGSALDPLASSFRDLGVGEALAGRLAALGVSAPTLIQQRVVPLLSQPRTSTPMLVQSPTGTGKSLAFLLPVIQTLLREDAERRRSQQPRTQVQALIVCPTQELALQTRAQVQSLLACDEHAMADTSFVALCIGGFESVEVQRADLSARPPAILIATPKRLNQVIFPQFQTHGRREGGSRRVAVADPLEDEATEADYLDVEHVGQQGKGESHAAPNYRASVAARVLLQSEYAKRSNIAVLRGGVAASGAAQDTAVDEDEDEANGIKAELLAPRHAVGYEAQRFLRTPRRLATEKLRSPLKRLMSDLKYLIIDEADDVLQPMSAHPNVKEKEMRTRHPKPSQVVLRGMQLLNPEGMQVIAASATINNQLVKLLWTLGFKNDPLKIRVEPRLSIHTQQGRQAADAAAKVAADERLALDSSHTSSSSSSSTSAAPSTANLATSSPGSVDGHREAGRPSIHGETRLSSYFECPPTISHFYVLAPSYHSWRMGTHSATESSLPSKAPYDYFAKEEERQAVHTHNMQVTHMLRRNAFVLDKICSLRVLLKQFAPRFPLLVIDEEKHALADISSLCESVGLKPTLLHQHLSAADVATRSRLFDSVREGKFDVLLVGLKSVRGLDLPMCDLVVNLAVCRDSHAYIHAAGRTGRFGREGSCITLVHPEEMANWKMLAHAMPATLTTARQIALPAALDPALHARFMRAYERTKSVREEDIALLDKHVTGKLRKKVMTDAERDTLAIKRVKQSARAKK